jgi:aspartate-semialdehyde dehydrogenase
MLKKKNNYVVAVVGATGAVGEEMIATLEQREFPVEKLRLFASERSEGKTLTFRDEEVPVETLIETA